MREREYPPIINAASRTLAAPLKEQQFYRTPSQTIGNNYSPHVQHLRVKGLYQQLKAMHKPGLLASFFPRDARSAKCVLPSVNLKRRCECECECEY